MCVKVEALEHMYIATSTLTTHTHDQAATAATAATDDSN